MATPLRPRREDPAAQRWAGAGGRAAAPPAAATSWPGSGGRPATATHHLPVRAARYLDQEPQAEPRGKARVILHGRKKRRAGPGLERRGERIASASRHSPILRHLGSLLGSSPALPSRRPPLRPETSLGGGSGYRGAFLTGTESSPSWGQKGRMNNFTHRVRAPGGVRRSWVCLSGSHRQAWMSDITALGSSSLCAVQPLKAQA
nr:uncharacterized protein LOC131755702 [Kogia breviceps]